jgi:hypothetical protein
MKVIVRRDNPVGLAVAEVAVELDVPFTICGANCPRDHAPNFDGILFLTNGNPRRIDATTMQEIAKFEKPALVVPVRWDHDGEFVRGWIARKHISNLFVTGNASVRASRRFVQAFLGGSSPPRRLTKLLARIFHRGWRCRALECG